MKTLLLTGKMGSGKSSFINELFMILNAPLTGVRSVRHFECEKFIGFDMNLIENCTVKDSWNIARFIGNEMIINADFKVATDFLENIRDKELVFLDEVGRFERNDIEYLEAVFTLVNSKTKSIISLKKEDLPFNKNLIEMSKHDEEIKFIDLDTVTKQDLDEFIIDLSGIDVKKIRKKVLYTENREVNLKKSINNREIDFRKIDNIFDVKADLILSERESSEILYYYTKNIDEMKKASDIGLVVLSDLKNI